MSGKAVLKRCVIAAAAVIAAVGAVGCASESDADRHHVGQQSTRTDMRNNAAGPAVQRVAADHIDIADRAAERIVSMPGIRQANVLITRRNAYVAAVMDSRADQLTRKTEDAIAAKVREVYPSVRNVYVSTNPEFVDRINGYVADIRAGRPVSGFVDQLNEIVQRLFPSAR